MLVEGMDTRNEDHLYDVRQKVGMVFQNPDNQIVATIVEEDVAFAPENLGVPPKEIRTRIDEAMKLAGIYEKRDAAPYKLSGGQKQRVAIAGVIAMRPDCLVLDESTAMLDPHGRAQVMNTIHQLRAAGITIVSITHYMEEAAQADRVLVMSRGPHRDGGHPRAGVQPNGKAAQLPSGRAPGRRAARCASQDRHPHAGERDYARALRRGAVQAAAVTHPSYAGTAPCAGGIRRERNNYVRDYSCRKSELHLQSGYAGRHHRAGQHFVQRGGGRRLFVGIIGSTGSGKSTLISHFNGLNRPTSGRVLVDGKDLWEQGADLRSFRFLVGLVMQYPEYQLFEETCAKDIAYGPRNMGLDEAEVQRRVKEAAAFVGLTDELLEKSPFELSGGQKRRVAIAGVMAMHPRVLVLDEPAAGLDPEGRDTILSQIKDYHEKTGITVLLVSHSMEDIAKYANRVLVMHRARIAMYDTVENVFLLAPRSCCSWGFRCRRSRRFS